jgi:hypothetical protein
MRDMKFMRDLIGTSALALIFSIGVAGAQTLPAKRGSAKSPNQQQTSPQGAPNQGTTIRIATMRDGRSRRPRTRSSARPRRKPASVTRRILPAVRRAMRPAYHRDMAEIPGATPQTMPAKYSQENADRAEYSIMGYPFSSATSRSRRSGRPWATRASPRTQSVRPFTRKPGTFLPPLVQGEEFPCGDERFNRRVARSEICEGRRQGAAHQARRTESCAPSSRVTRQYTCV